MFNKLSAQFIRFCFVGVFATIINYGVFYLLVNFVRLDYILSSGAGFFAGVAAGFPFNRSWTFQDKAKGLAKQMSLYMSVYIASLILSLVLLKILVGYFGLDPLLANIFCICLTVCTNFIGIKLFIFRN